MAIRLAVEGAEAVAATEALLAIDGISGRYAVPEEAEREGVLATIATIIGIVGGTIAIAEKIYEWYQAYRQRSAGPSGTAVEKVVIVGDDGRRLILENATVEQIKQLLDASVGE